MPAIQYWEIGTSDMYLSAAKDSSCDFRMCVSDHSNSFEFLSSNGTPAVPEKHLEAHSDDEGGSGRMSTEFLAQEAQKSAQLVTMMKFRIFL